MTYSNVKCDILLNLYEVGALIQYNHIYLSI